MLASSTAGEVLCVDMDGSRKEEGESWTEDCNNCMCTKSGKSCTKRLCNFSVPFLSSSTRAEEVSGCLDGQGTRREEGDNWTENCNSCMCTNSRSSCTKRLCAAPFLASSIRAEESSQCLDREGTTRDIGESWTEDCNSCMCTKSGSSCTKKLCNFDLRAEEGSQCLDREGTTREIGESWTEDCNNCMCTKSGSSCTKKLCNFLGHNLNPGLECTDEQNLTRGHLESWEQVPSPPEVVKEVADIQLVWLTDLSMEIQLGNNKTDMIFLAPTSNIPGEETPCLFSGIVGKDQDSLVTVSGCQDDEEVTVSIASKRVPGGFVDLTISEGTTYSVQVVGSFGFGFESSTCTCTDGEIACVVQAPRPDNPFAPPEVPAALLMASAPQLPSAPQSLLGSAPQLPSSAPQLPSVPKSLLGSAP